MKISVNIVKHSLLLPETNNEIVLQVHTSMNLISGEGGREVLPGDFMAMKVAKAQSADDEHPRVHVL